MYIVHRDKVKACESEMAQFSEAVYADSQGKIDAMKKSRIATLEATEKLRKEEALKRAAEAERQKAELEAAIAAANAEQKREQEVGNIKTFAKVKCPAKFERHKVLSAEIHKIEQEKKQFEEKFVSGDNELESNDEYVKLITKRNGLILEKRTIEMEIDAEYRAQEKKGAQE